LQNLNGHYGKICWIYEDGKKKNTVIFLAGLTLLALILRLAALWIFPIVQRDGILYLEMMDAWNDLGCYQETLKGFQGSNSIPPFPLFLMKLLVPLGFSAECSAKCFSIACGGFVPAIGYGITWTLTKRQYIAFAAGVLFAVHPVFIEFSTQPLRDGFYIFWAGLTLLFLCRGMMEAKWYDWCAAGIFAATSFMTRYETLEFFPLVVLFFVSAPVFHCYSWKKAVLHGMLFFVMVLLMIFLLHNLMGTWYFFCDNSWHYYYGKWRLLQRIWSF